MPPPKKRQKHSGAVVGRSARSRRHAAAAADADDPDADYIDAASDDASLSASSGGSSQHRQQRPNRWRRDRRAWLARTQAEQWTAAAVYTARARDLAAHLYNTYALKQRREEWASDEGPGKGEDEDEADDDHRGREDSVALARRDVKCDPSAESSDWDDDADYYHFDFASHRHERSTSAPPSAAGSAHGSSRRGRPWAPQPWWTAWPLRMHERVFAVRAAGEDGEHDYDDPVGDDGDGDDDDDERPPPASDVLLDELTATVLRLAKVRFRRWERRRRGMKRTRPTVRRRRCRTRPLLALPSADDDLSALLLRPGVRHLLAQTDRLLAALHSARVATAGGAADARPRSFWRLRDWADVVGAAALTGGFGRAVLARTAQRCADLFGQSMVLVDGPSGPGAGAVPVQTVYRPRPAGERFGHLKEDGEEEEEEEELPVAAYEGQLRPGPPLAPLGGDGHDQEIADHQADNVDDDDDDDDDDGLTAWRRRTQTRYEAWYRDRRQRQQQQLLKQQLLQSKSQEPEQQEPRQEPQEPQQPQPPQPPQPTPQKNKTTTHPFVPGALQPLWRCRHKTCDRSAIGFERRSNLARHYKLVHKE